MNGNALEIGTKFHHAVEALISEHGLDKVSQADQPISKIKPTPQVGDILWVKHEVKYNQGAVVGLMRNPKPIRTEITAVYLDGSVRNNHSDVWECKPSSLNNWETINPDRVEK